MTDSQQLLAEYLESRSESAFRELVARYIHLVHSAAIRLVDGDAHLAEDVAQTVFADLARMAGALPSDVLPGGWLHRHTCFVASNLMRGERRRRFRESQSAAMNSTDDHSPANLALIAPVLDEAVNQLETEDRKAILLRFFEQRDFRSVGQALGASEEAARKRVNRALEKLRASLLRRGVALSTAALASTLATAAVSAAPPALAAAIAGAALAGATTGLATTATTTLLNLMTITKLKAAAAGAIIAAAGLLVPLTLQHHNNTTLQSENERLRREAAEFRDLTSENARLTGLLAPAEDAPSDRLADEQLRELLRLRSEVGRLRQQIANAPVASPAPGSLLAGMTANPEMWKVLRDQQKQGMTAMYKEFATLAGLSAEQGENLVNLLADDVMENINLVTAALRDNPDPAQLEWLFARQEAVLLEQVGALLGPEGLAQYQDYTRDLASYLTAAQFKATLSAGDAGEDMARQLRHAMREETERVIEAAGLPPDYQTLPMMNFRNIADPSQADRSLDLLNDIYERTRNRAAAFLSAEELDKFASFATDAVSMNRMALLLNRKLMAPTPQ